MPSLSVPLDTTAIGKHLLRVFARLAEFEQRLRALERQPKRGRPPKPKNNDGDLAARDRALEKRKAARDRAEMRARKIELTAGGGTQLWSLAGVGRDAGPCPKGVIERAPGGSA
jgi:hypothetical protein